MSSRILIIEDEEAIADLEKDYLELSDFEVEIQNTGDGGLKAALEKDFNLIILDLMLPGVDGFEVCRQIREKKDIPILMVSAKKDDIDKIRGLGLGADDYMTKPFSPSGKSASCQIRKTGGHQCQAPERYCGNQGSAHRQNRQKSIRGRRGKDLYHQGIRFADLPCGASQSCIHQGRAVPSDLGHGLHRRHCNRYGPHQKNS